MTAILTCHNRRELTLACLSSYFSQVHSQSMTLAAVLVDDGSADGTMGAVRGRFPHTKVIAASGNLYWARGMALAEEHALVDDPDYLLWLNDDVALDDDALERLLATAGAPTSACIAVGALRDPVTGSVTYSGVRKPGFHPLVVERIQPQEIPVAVETFNGNVALVPRAARMRVGLIDAALKHSYADFDYGLRARRKGVAVLLAPGTVGTCTRDGDRRPWLDPTLTRRARFRALFSLKGLPLGSRAHYLKRNGGPLWMVFWLSPYVRATLMIMRLPRQTGGDEV